MKKVFLLEDDHKIVDQVKEMLSDYEIISEADNDKYLKKIAEVAPDLLLIDFDLRAKDGLLTYREITQKYPHNKAIMFSASNSIPLAVAATKLGAVDFLRKPLSIQVLRDSVGNALNVDETVVLDLNLFDDVEWLSGISLELKRLLEKIRVNAASFDDLVICGERGIPLIKIAEMLHKLGKNSDKRFVEMNLSSFLGTSSETHFFLTLKELLAAKSEMPGTIYLSNVENISDSFRQSLLKFVESKKSIARILIGTNDPDAIPDLKVLNIPTVAMRREDVLIIALSYLKRFAPLIKYVSPQAMEFFMYYDFPGNYIELKDILITAGASYPTSEVLNLKNLPVDMSLFENVLHNKIFAKEKYDLVYVREEFEKLLFTIVLEKVNFDINLTSRFLEMPKTQVNDRLTILGLPE